MEVRGHLHANSSRYMVPEGSLPCSRQPTTVPYPEPDASSSYLSTLCP